MPTASEGTPLAHDAVPRHIRSTQLGQYFGCRVFHVWLLLGSCLAQMPAAAIIGATPYLLKSIQREFGIEDSLASLVHTGVLLGSLAGVVVCGRFCDQYGRKFTIVACMCWITGLNLLCLLIPTGQGGLRCLLTLRIVLGMPYGGLLFLAAPYIIEFTSDEMRGAAAVLTGVGWNAGRISGLLTIGVVGEEDWRLCLALAPVLPFLLGLFVMSLLPESPRWLRVDGRKAESQKVLDAIFSSPPVVGHAFVGKAPEITLESMTDSDSCRSFRDVLTELFGPSLVRVTLVTTSTYAILVSMGNVTDTWAPRILELVSGEERVGLSIFRCCEALAAVVMVLIALTVDTFGRRYFIWSSVFTLAAVFAGLSCASSLEVAKMLWLVRAGAESMLWGALSTYMTEAFPTSLRGSALGLTQVFGRLLSVVLPMLVGGLFSAVSIGRLMFGFAGAYLCGLLSSLLIPEETAKNPTMDSRPSHCA